MKSYPCEYLGPLKSQVWFNSVHNRPLVFVPQIALAIGVQKLQGKRVECSQISS